MSVPTVVLADDHHVVRHSLRVLLEVKAGFKVLGEAENGLEALKLVEELRPDVLVIDLMMPRMNGLEAARQVGKRSPDTKVVILSMYDDESYVVEALRAGAKGYVLKSSTSEELVLAIQEVIIGHRYLSSPLSERAIETYTQSAKATKMDVDDLITPREREVLRLAAEGYTSTEIATALYISPRTAQTHRSNLMGKLGLHTQTDLVRYAMRKGIILGGDKDKLPPDSK